MAGRLVAPPSASWTAVGLLLVLAASSDAVDIVSRRTWGAAAPKFTNRMRNTATHVVVHHTATQSCGGSACYAQLRTIQQGHFNKRFGDIGYNFLIGTDGTIYEGQGYGRKAAHAAGANSFSIGVAFLGNYQTSTPGEASVTTLSNLISDAISRGHLRSNYKLVGHKSVSATACPGNNLYNRIKSLENFSTAL